jgi:hypothetical protein
MFADNLPVNHYDAHRQRAFEMISEAEEQRLINEVRRTARSRARAEAKERAGIDGSSTVLRPAGLVRRLLGRRDFDSVN